MISMFKEMAFPNDFSSIQLLNNITGAMAYFVFRSIAFTA